MLIWTEECLFNKTYIQCSDVLPSMLGWSIGEPMNSITSLSEDYPLNLANKIIGDSLHILPSEYVLLSTGKRYTMPRMWICAVFNRVKRL